MRAAVIPALRVHAIYAIELQISALDFVRDGANHAAVLVLEEASLRGGKDQQRDTAAAKDQQLHLALQVMRKPFVVFTIHDGTRCSTSKVTSAPHIHRQSAS